MTPILTGAGVWATTAVTRAAVARRVRRASALRNFSMTSSLGREFARRDDTTVDELVLAREGGMSKPKIYKVQTFDHLRWLSCISDAHIAEHLQLYTGYV